MADFHRLMRGVDAIKMFVICAIFFWDREFWEVKKFGGYNFFWNKMF